jgi:hypothetical protein
MATLQIQLRLVRNKGWSTSTPANTSDVLALMNEITALKKEAGDLKPNNIEVQVVEAVQGIYMCQHCGKENHLDAGRYKPLVSAEEKAQRDHRQIEANGNASPSGGDGTPSPAMPLEPNRNVAGALKSVATHKPPR